MPLPSSTELLNALRSYAVGSIKGNTVDTLGAPVDIINEALRPIGLASEKPIGGSKNLREVFGVGAEDKNVAETAGSLLSLGGLSKAMIVGAAKIKDAATIDKFLKAESSGSSKASLFTNTGIYRDPTDSKLRAVVSDVKTTIPADAVNLFSGQIKEHQVVGSVLEGSEALKLYPRINVMKAKDYPDKVIGSGRYSSSQNAILAAANPDIDQLKATMLHEVQHGVQADEGFSKGGNPQMFEKFDTKAAQAKIDKFVEDNPGLASESVDRFREKVRTEKQKAYLQYENLPGEEEARFTGATRNLTQDRLNETVLNLLRQNSAPTLRWEDVLKNQYIPPK